MDFELPSNSGINAYQILYRTATGENKLSTTYHTRTSDDAIRATTDYVRANLINIYRVPLQM